jgi:hypothetical protein
MRGTPRPKQLARKDLDLPLKLQVAGALASSGYFSRVNVLLSASGSHGLADVTDIDVLAIRYDVMFKREVVAVSCKGGTSKTLSAAREAFYLRGVLDYVGAGEGVAAFSHKHVDLHLRDLGERLGVLMLSGNEVTEWCNALTNGIAVPGYFHEAAHGQYVDAWAKLGRNGLADYLRTDYWFHLDFRNLQNVIAHMRKVADKLSGSENWHQIVAWDIAAHLSLPLFDLCRKIQMLGVRNICDTTAAFLFGGAASLKARRDLYGKVQQLLASTGVVGRAGPALPPLEPLYSQALAELAVRFIERPHSAILVPVIIQDNIWRLLGAEGLPPHEDKVFLAAEKFTQDLLDFIKSATDASWMPRV